MLIQLIKNKYAKSFSGKKATKTQQNNKKNNNYSTLCLIANQAGIITDFQFNAIKREFKRKAKKKAQIFISLTNWIPITKKPQSVRLGRGKANVKYHAIAIKKGSTLFEIKFNNFNSQKIKNELKTISKKLPVKTYLFDLKKRWIF